MEKIRLLFESLKEKFPEIIDDDFVNKAVDSINEVLQSEIEVEKDKILAEELEVEKEKIRKELTEELEVKNEEEKEKLVDAIDLFLDECVESFSKENSVRIDESIKSNVSLDVVEKIVDVLKEHGIEAPDSVTDRQVYEDRIDRLNKIIESMSEKITDSNRELLKVKAISIVDDVCEDMNYDETLQFYSLIEEFDIDNIDEFQQKVEKLAEMLEKKKEEDEDEDKEDDSNSKKIDKKDVKYDEDEDDEDVDESKKFMKAVGRNLK